MSKTCLLCGENETHTQNNICDPCYDNAGELCERNARLFAKSEQLLEAVRELNRFILSNPFAFDKSSSERAKSYEMAKTLVAKTTNLILEAEGKSPINWS